MLAELRENQAISDKNEQVRNEDKHQYFNEDVTLMDGKRVVGVPTQWKQRERNCHDPGCQQHFRKVFFC